MRWMHVVPACAFIRCSARVYATSHSWSPLRLASGLAYLCVFQVLHAAATLAHEFIMDEARVAPRALLDTAVQLHHVMLSLQGLQGFAVQAVIAKVRGWGDRGLQAFDDHGVRWAILNTAVLEL